VHSARDAQAQPSGGLPMRSAAPALLPRSSVCVCVCVCVSVCVCVVSPFLLYPYVTAPLARVRGGGSGCTAPATPRHSHRAASPCARPRHWPGCVVEVVGAQRPRRPGTAIVGRPPHAHGRAGPPAALFCVCVCVWWPATICCAIFGSSRLTYIHGIC
jgi:hypothetical protein